MKNEITEMQILFISSFIIVKQSWAVSPVGIFNPSGFVAIF